MPGTRKCRRGLRAKYKADLPKERSALHLRVYERAIEAMVYHETAGVLRIFPHCCEALAVPARQLYYSTSAPVRQEGFADSSKISRFTRFQRNHLYILTPTIQSVEFCESIARKFRTEIPPRSPLNTVPLFRRTAAIDRFLLYRLYRSARRLQYPA